MTGVQTCALPICARDSDPGRPEHGWGKRGEGHRGREQDADVHPQRRCVAVPYFTRETLLPFLRAERVTTSTAYLTKDVIARPNLTVATGATVRALACEASPPLTVSYQATRILFSSSSGGKSPKATGVEFTNVETAYAKEKAGPVFRAVARKQVVLAAGSLATPQVCVILYHGLSLYLTFCNTDPRGVGNRPACGAGEGGCGGARRPARRGREPQGPLCRGRQLPVSPTST